MTEESVCIGHEPCPECGSQDNLGRYDDGHGYCFGCGYYEYGDDEERSTTTTKKSKAKVPVGLGEVRDVVSRGINVDTTKKFQYRVGPYNDTPAHFAYYFDKNRKPVAVKVRFPDKDFLFLGDTKKVGLYGQWLWRDSGKMLVITEGEIDALSVSQLQGNKWPVVSVPKGSKGAAKSIREELDWIENFEKVIFMFDMDEAGQDAAIECADLLSPGKAFIAQLPLKDANEMLQARRGGEVIDAIWGAKEYRPDGIVFGQDITLDSLREEVTPGRTLPYPILQRNMHGLRKGELTILTAGSGIGKSTLAREIAYHLHQNEEVTIGNIYLEENAKKTAQGYVAIHNDIPMGVLREDPECLSDKDWERSVKEVIHERMYFYDHFGSLESDHLISKIRYMSVSLGTEFVILDHISIVVSGQTGSGEGERRDIDRLMTSLRSLIEKTGVHVIAIVHLKQPEGKPHEEGGRVTLSQLRGSGSLKQLPDNVVALERDQQDEDQKNVAQIRVLKCREFGSAVGLADLLLYDDNTGRLLPTTEEEIEGMQFDDETGEASDLY